MTKRETAKEQKFADTVQAALRAKELTDVLLEIANR
jgi:hypothetical protein